MGGIGRLAQQFLLALGASLLCASLTHAQEESGSEQRRIREIRIHRATVYPEDKARESAWAEYVNRFHIKTRESVVRRQLLFKEGDVLDQELLEASERALRRFRFLNTAEVTVVPVDEQSVDVEVRTRDAWSLVPGLNIKGGGGLTTTSVHLMELNLLGFGKTAYIEAMNESDVGTTTKLGYRDYQMFDTRWVGSAVYQNGPLVESFLAHASLPLYSPDSKWAYGGTAYKGDQIIRRFEDGEESSRFERDKVYFTGYMRHAYGERFHKRTVKLQLKYETEDFDDLGEETTEPPPPDTANLTPLAGFNTEDISWAKRTFVNKMGFVEDDWVGTRSASVLGYGIPLEDGFELWDLRLSLSDSSAFAHKQLMYLHAAIDSEVVRNTVVFGNFKYYKKFKGHTFASRFKLQLGYELDSSRQFTLGADSGLRGYPARQFSGERLMLLNLEDRQFWGNHSIGIDLAIGTVVFLDAGNVWEEEEDADPSDLNWSTGIGIRLGFNRLPHQPIFRLDYGWALDGEGGALTVGMEQHF